MLVEVFSPPRDDWGAIEAHEPGPGRWPLSRPERELLERAKARLDRLELYPRPVRIERVR